MKGPYVKHPQRRSCTQENDIAQGAQPLDLGFPTGSNTFRGIPIAYDVFDDSIQSSDDSQKDRSKLTRQSEDVGCDYTRF